MMSFRTPPVASTRLRWGPAFAAALLVFAAGAEAAEEGGTPARLVPAKGLTVLVEFDGVGDRAEAWKATAAYAVLNSTPVGETLSSVARQVADRLLKDAPEAKISSADLASHCVHVFRNGFLLAVYDEGNGKATPVAVLRGFGSKDARARVDRLFRLLNEGEALPKPVRFRGRDLYQIEKIAISEKPKPADEDQERSGVPPALDDPGAPATLKPAGAGQEQPPAAKGPAPAPDVKNEEKKDDDAPTWELTWWFEGNDLIITDGQPRGATADAKTKRALKPKDAKDRVSAVLDAIEGKTPNAEKHPGREAALAEGRGIDGFAPDGLIVIESANGGVLLQDLMKQVNAPEIAGVALPVGVRVRAVTPDDEPSPKASDAEKDKPKVEVDEFKALGLDRLKRVVGRWGFQGKALMTVVRFEVPAPRTGMLRLLDQPGLRIDRLPPIPKDAGAFAVGSFDTGKSYDTFVGLLKTLDPASTGAVDEALGELTKAVRDATGQRLREDLLAHLGSAWCVYTSRYEFEENAPTPVPALLVEVRDPKAFAEVLDALVVRVNETLRGSKDVNAKEARKEGVEPPALVLERLPAPERGYRLISPEGVVPWAGADIQPTIMLGRSFVVVAMNPKLARAALAAESRQADRWAPGAELAKALAGLPAGVTSLSVGDVRDSSWPEAFATLPRMVQYLGNLLGASEAEAEPTPGSAALTLLGVPAPGGFRIKIDPAKVPRASQVRALLFPSVLATVVDDRGIRFIGAEALPFACIGSKSVTDQALKGNFMIKVNQFLNR